MKDGALISSLLTLGTLTINSTHDIYLSRLHFATSVNRELIRKSLPSGRYCWNKT